MNCPSRPEPEGPDFNQNPSSLAADLTTRQDLNGTVNSRILRRMVENEIENVGGGDPDGANGGEDGEKKEAVTERVAAVVGHVTELAVRDADGSGDESGGGGGRWVSVSMTCLLKARDMVVKFGTFVGDECCKSGVIGKGTRGLDEVLGRRC